MLPKCKVTEANLTYKQKYSKSKLTNDEYICNLKRHGIYNTIPDETYQGSNTPIYHICKIHNFRFKAQPSNVMNGYPCPLCNKENVRLNKEANYKQKLIDKNIPVTLDDKYISSMEKVYHICLQCGNRWKITPKYVLNNKFSCPECVKKIRAKNKTKTQSEFEHDVYELFGNSLSVVGNYSILKNKIDMHCNICDYNWSPTAKSILSGHSCPKCTNHYTMSHEEFLQKIEKTKNKNIEILSKYKDSKTPIQCKCKNCGYIWNTTFGRILQGSGCKKCADIERGKLRTIELNDITKRLHNRFPYIDIIGEYTNSTTYTTCKCNLCNYTWDTQISPLLSHKYGCPKCALEFNKNKSRKTHEDYVKEVLSYNPNVEIVSEYNGGSNDIVAKCLICYNEWKTRATNLLRCGCPSCNASKLESKTEFYLKSKKIIFNKGMKYQTLFGVGSKPLSYDFYLPKYNLLIECQGEQHERPIEYFGGIKKFVIQKIHDTRKRKYAHEHNIKLLEIWYYENNKIDKILEQTLNNLKSESVETVIPA